LGEAISRENLAEEDINKKDKEVESIPIDGWRSRNFSSNYSKLRYSLRVIDLRWQKAVKMYTPGTVEFEKLKEQILHEHANAFFAGVITYTPLP
jgi:hypothetical protein